MSFSDPTSITINTVAESFAEIERSPSYAVYRTSDQEFELRISRTNGTRNRHLVKITRKKIAPDPIDATNAEVSFSAHMVMDVPEWGYTSTEVSDVVTGLASFLSAANVAKVLAGEV